MSTNDKDFKVKNGIQVAGTATFSTDIILNNIPLAYDSISKRLKMFIDNQWKLVALSEDILDLSQPFDGGSVNTVYSGGIVIDGGLVA